MITESGDARFAIDQFGRWIANADTKAGLLAAALVIMGGALGDQSRVVGHRLPPTSFADWISLVALLAATGAIVTSIGFLVGVVSPRLEQPDGFSRYSFPSVADAPIAELVRVDGGSDREHGWRTASVLASIACRKFRCLRRAFAWWVVAGFAFVVLALVDFGR